MTRLCFLKLFTFWKPRKQLYERMSRNGNAETVFGVISESVVDIDWPLPITSNAWEKWLVYFKKYESQVWLWPPIKSYANGDMIFELDAVLQTNHTIIKHTLSHIVHGIFSLCFWTSRIDSGHIRRKPVHIRATKLTGFQILWHSIPFSTQLSCNFPRTIYQSCVSLQSISLRRRIERFSQIDR